jgi:cytochrome c2
MTRHARAAVLVAALAGAASAACHGETVEAAYRVETGGSPARGHDIIRDSGCAACHTVPGVRGANGLVGPPLILFARRGFIAGRVSNNPSNLVRWLFNPRDIDPETVMPRVGLSQQQARDVAAYLYTLK